MNIIECKLISVGEILLEEFLELFNLKVGDLV